MPDLFDDAQRVAELQQQDALESHHRRVDQIRTAHSRTHCLDCGEEIPEKRRAAVKGCRRCLRCQTDFEQGDRA